MARWRRHRDRILQLRTLLKDRDHQIEALIKKRDEWMNLALGWEFAAKQWKAEAIKLGYVVKEDGE